MIMWGGGWPLAGRKRNPEWREKPKPLTWKLRVGHSRRKEATAGCWCEWLSWRTASEGGPYKCERNPRKSLIVCYRCGSGTRVWICAQSGSEENWGEDGGDHYEQDYRGKQTFIDDANSSANTCEDQANLTARHHTEAYSQAIHGWRRSPAGGYFPNDGDNSKRQPREQYVFAEHGFQFDLNSHPDKKKRNDQRFEGRKQLVERCAFDFVVKEAVEDHAGGEGADDGGEFGDVGQPRQQERETDAKEELQISYTHGGETAHEFGHEPGSDAERSDKKERGFAGGRGDGEHAYGASDGEAADDGEDDEAEHVINDCRAEDDTSFFGGVAAKIAEDTCGDANASGGKNPANKQIRSEHAVGMEQFHGAHAKNHGEHDAEDGDEGGRFPDALHFHEADFQTNEEEQDEDGQARDDVDKGVDVHVRLALWSAEKVCEQFGVRAGRKKLAPGVREIHGTCICECRDAGEGVAFAKDSEGGTAEIVAEIACEKTDEEFTENGGLAEPFHEESAEGGSESDEDRGDEDGDYGIGVGDFAAGEEKCGDLRYRQHVVPLGAEG
jgi:hypothetical protein